MRNESWVLLNVPAARLIQVPTPGQPLSWPSTNGISIRFLLGVDTTEQCSISLLKSSTKNRKGRTEQMKHFSWLLPITAFISLVSISGASGHDLMSDQPFQMKCRNGYGPEVTTISINPQVNSQASVKTEFNYTRKLTPDAESIYTVIAVTPVLLRLRHKDDLLETTHSFYDINRQTNEVLLYDKTWDDNIGRYLTEYDFTKVGWKAPKNFDYKHKMTCKIKSL